MVCKEVGKRQLGKCSDCNQPCHSKCTDKKKDRQCNLCNSAEQSPAERTLAAPKASKPVKQTSAQVSKNATNTSTRRETGATQTAPHYRGSLGSLTPAGSRLPRKSNTSASSVKLRGSRTKRTRPSTEAPADEVGEANSSQAQELAADGDGRDTVFQAPSLLLESNTSTGENTCKSPNFTEMIDVNCDDLKSLKSCNTLAIEPPLGDENLRGVTHINMPVSTMEVIFNRFDVLEGMLIT